MQSKAKTVAEYLKSLPADRRAAIETVRKVFLKNLSKGFEEGMQYGMIGYYVPHSIFPAGYHCNPKEPLPFGGIASQKNHMSMYMMCIYADPEHQDWFVNAWKATGKKLDMGKGCIRFKKIEDVPLDVVGEAVRRIPLKRFLEFYESATEGRRKGSSKSAATKARPDKSAKKAPKAAAKSAKKKTKAKAR